MKHDAARSDTAPVPGVSRTRGSRRYVRYLVFALAIAGVAAAALYGAARMYLPAVLARKGDVEAQLSAALQQPVRIGRMEIAWDGINPGIQAWDVAAYRRDGAQAAVRIAELRVSFAPLPLLAGRLEIHRLVVVRPSAALARRTDGRIGIVGLERRDDGAEPGSALAWVLAQRRLVVRDGELDWSDALDPDGAIRISGIDLRLANAGARHRLFLKADFPPALCADCRLRADVRGVPGAGIWSGEISLRAQGLRLEALPLLVRERLPGAVRGQVDAELAATVDAGRLVRVQGTLAAAQLELPGVRGTPLTARRIAGQLDWERSTAGWQLEISRLTLGLTRASWYAGEVRLARRGAETVLLAEHIDLDDVTAFARAHAAQSPALARWAEIGPSGRVLELSARLRGPLAAPSDYALEARLERVGTAAHAYRPSATGVSGRLIAAADGGRFELDATNLSVQLPRVFRAALTATRARGSLQWRKTDSAWHVDGSDLHVDSPDGKGNGTLRLVLPFDRARSPVLTLQVDFRDGNGTHARRYFPRQLPPKVLAWMESAFLGGRVVSGSLLYDGPIRAFPFEQGQGRFELRASVRDGVYRYLPGWTPLTNAQVEVAIDGADAVITGQGRIGALVARDVRVAVARPPGETHRVVRVTGKVDGPVAETLRILRAVDDPDARWREVLGALAHASGTGALALDVRVPLGDERPTFNADYRFENASFKLASGAGIEAATGTVGIGERGLRAANVRATLFGGPLEVTGATENETLRLRAHGRARVSELVRGRGPLAARLTGTLPWSLELEGSADTPAFRFEADLRELRSRLPPPLAKPDAGGAERLRLATVSGEGHVLVVGLDALPLASGTFALVRDARGWRFERGRLDLGRPAAPLPETPGLTLGISAEALDVDEWLPLLTARAGGFAPPVAVNTVSADVRHLGLLGRDWGRVLVHVVRHGNAWRAVIDGDAATGELVYAPADTPPRVRLDLAHLRLVPRRQGTPEAGRGGGVLPDPRRLPIVELRAGSFEYQGRRLGTLVFDARPQPQGWRIERFELTQPETRVAARGDWRRIGGRDASEIALELRSEDLGAALAAWGMPGQLSGGRFDVRAELTWSGPLLRPTLAALGGKVEIAGEKGRFLQFDPGAARLFGLLDLRSIGRYLTLDFSPAFGKGYAFDTMKGTLTIEQGNASTSGFAVAGPQLSLSVIGRVGLAAEDYDLILEASPRIGDTLTLTSWGLFGPQAAAAVYALRKLFKRQIRESTRVAYRIVGPWDNPTITRLTREPTKGAAELPSDQPP